MYSCSTMCANMLKTTQKGLFKCTAIFLSCCLVILVNTVEIPLIMQKEAVW